jgi:predicted nucleic-acid-binding Zn-ribbon protein
MLVKSEVVVNEKAKVVSICSKCYNNVFVDDKLWTVDFSKLFKLTNDI